MMAEGVTPENTPTLVGGANPAKASPENTPADPANPEAAAGGEGADLDKGKDSPADKPEKVGAPEEYEDFELPEGVEVNEEILGEFKPLAKELNLTQEQAQKLVSWQAEAAKTHEAGVNEYYANLMTEWQESVRSDKEIGGKAFDESVSYAKAALEAFGTAELMEVLETTGMGNHPEFVRVFARMGKAVKEDGIRVGSSNPEGPKDPAHILYPNQN